MIPITPCLKKGRPTIPSNISLRHINRIWGSMPFLGQHQIPLYGMCVSIILLRIVCVNNRGIIVLCAGRRRTATYPVNGMLATTPNNNIPFDIDKVHGNREIDGSPYRLYLRLAHTAFLPLAAHTTLLLSQMPPGPYNCFGDSSLQVS